MPLYKVTKVMQYTEDVYVESESVTDAIQKSYSLDGERNNDDWLHDVRVRTITE